MMQDTCAMKFLTTTILLTTYSLALAADPSFVHGVASGAPMADSIVLWTRVTPADANPVSVSWEVSTTNTFSSLQASGTVSADSTKDYTVKVIPTGLAADTTYYYRFSVNGGAIVTPVGKTKTLPTGPTSEVKFAVFSCANITAEYFDAYAKAAHVGDYDALIHVGDYIYEYGKGGYVDAEDNFARFGFEPDKECVTLEDYRLRYAQYTRQPSLRNARASAPLICVWDDHETANDAYATGAQNHDPATEGSWEDRVAAALQAYYEWNPVREPGSGNRKEAYTTYNFGDLVSLHMLETRLVARDKQLELAPTNAEVGARITEILSSPTLTGQYAARYTLTPPTGPTDVAGITAFSTALGPLVFNEMVFANVTAMYAGNRNLLGPVQLGWLQGQMAGSSATYQVLGQQVLMGNMTMPAELLIELANNDVKEATVTKYATPIFKLANGFPLTPTEQAVYDNATPLPYNSDAWDGYGKERETILQTALGLNKKLVVFAGDTHNAWANQLKTMSPTGPGLAPYGTVAGIELATPGVSSPGIEKYFPGQEGVLRDLFLGYSPGLKFANLSNRGYLDVTFTPTGVNAKFLFRQRSGGEWQEQPISSSDAKALTVGTHTLITEPDTDTDGLSDWREGVSGTSATIADTDGDGINDKNEFFNVLFGLNPLTANDLEDAFEAVELRGKDAVVAEPSRYNLYNATSIQDLRGTGNLLIQAANGKVTLTLPVEKSGDLNEWNPAGELFLELDQSDFPGKQFFRFDSVLGE
jgi:phosphodiesterase/alkaline phosphatase D-like protein